MPALSIKNIHKVYHEPGRGRIEAIKDITLEVAQGEFFILLGPSGSGKSTLLRIMAGLDTATSGTVVLDPHITSHDMSFVFQQFALLPWLTIHENIELNLRSRIASEHKRKELVFGALKEFGLEKFGRSMPHELSGGMRQRVGIARAFITNPKIIFLDEPFSELDFFTAQELREELLQLWHKTGTTVIMVSHNIEEALMLSDRIGVITPRPGTLRHMTHNELARPRNARTDEFFALEDTLIGYLRHSM